MKRYVWGIEGIEALCVCECMYVMHVCNVCMQCLYAMYVCNVREFVLKMIFILDPCMHGKNACIQPIVCAGIAHA